MEGIEMVRKVVLESGKKDDLIKVALELFLENGYEDTSIRMILDKVGGKVGMFYHYFKSKEEIFDKAIKLFFAEYSKEVDEILNHTDNDFKQILNAILSHLEETIYKYNQLNTNKFHWSMKIALNQLTIRSLVPHITEIIIKLKRTGTINPIFQGTDSELASFLLFGIHGILHEKPFAEINSVEMAKKKAVIMKLIVSVLGIKEREEHSCLEEQ
jgi:AcrR family transcriptional regulator